MNHKNLFIFNGIVVLIFGVLLLVKPSLLGQMYIENWAGMSDALAVVDRGYGSLLIGFGAGLLAATKASLSYGRRAILIMIVIANLVSLPLYIYFTVSGVMTGMGWGLVVLALLLLLWAGSLLLRERVGD